MPRIIAPFALLCFGLIVQANAQMIRSTAITYPISFSYPAPDEVFFKGAIARDGDSLRPYFVFKVPAPNETTRFAYIFVKPELEEEVPVDNPEAYGPISETYPAGGVIEQDRGQYVLRAWLSPVRRTSDNKILRLVKGDAVAVLAPSDAGAAQRSGPDFKTVSALANGRIHKVSVDKPGIYKLDFNFFKDRLKVEPSTLDVTRIGVYGNGGGRIPQANNALRIDDIEPCAIQAVGFEDGQFNSGDYLLWYAEGPDAWTFDPASRTYQMEKNIYDTKNHYYILLDGPGSPRLSERTAGTSGDYVSSASLDAQRIEDEKVNLLGRYRPPGSGQEWYGDEMAVVNQLDYTSRFDFADMITSDSLHYKLRFAIRAATSPRIFLRINQSEFSRTVGGVNLDNYESSFANDGVLQGGMVTGTPVTQLLVRYPAASGLNSRAWVDYLQLNFWRKNTYRSGKPIMVRDPRSAFLGTPTFEVTGLPASGEVWDITNPQMPVRQAYLSGANVITFTGPAPDPEIPSAFYCFDPSRDVAVPAYVGSVANQNLHGLNAADLIIVYHDEYRDAAETLAAHRRTHNGYTVIAVPTSQVFEEFGGGSKDPSALRDFARMIYLRDPGFHYLLLIGDATYDYLQRDPELPYHNYVPAFETEESLDPIRSFPADDFYALLDDQEGSNLIGAIDIAVGRFPVSSAEEANLIVQKILHYETSPAVLGDWRNRVVMVADDQDGNIHLGQADGLSNMTAQRDPVLNQEKLYLDAFPQQSTPGGDRYPAVNAALDQHVQNGALTVTYMGHGGPNGWTQERVLGINQAQGYSNLNNLPLFITATCSFAGYDEPGFVSAGEHLLVNPRGGAIGLMTTVRAVFSGSNARLTEAVLKRIYEPDAPGIYPPIGEVLRRAKNDNALDTLDNNARKFTLLGDPSMLLAIPRYTVSVTQVGSVPVGSGAQDTLSALEKTTVRGVILDHGGAVMTGFNGRVYLTLFDKVQKRKTLGNDADSPVREFLAQNKQLFRGTATVTNGEWAIEFVLPKDIDFNFGAGRISLYAEDGTTDAAGYFTGFIIGGVSSEGLADDNPPLVRLFMNDSLFVSGGITDPNPDIYILLSDDNGINVSGTSIGHDIEAILDGDERNSIILNDYYQAAQDDYRSGSVRYPLKNLAPGLHTLHVTAWDLANNPGQAYVEFVVRDDAGAVITNLGCDPNPFDGETRFHFEHNRPGSIIDAYLRIFDLRGALVRELQVEDLLASGYRVEQLTWDGDNQTGAQVAAGMYIYRLEVTFDNGGTTERVAVEAGKVIRL